jgi:hypothetical protein
MKELQKTAMMYILHMHVQQTSKQKLGGHDAECDGVTWVLDK